MNFSLIRTLSFCLLGISSLALNAQEFRVGFVNTDRIFREANTAKVAQTKLEQEFSKREKELVEIGNSLKSNAEKLERDSPTLSDTQRSTRQRQLLTKTANFNANAANFKKTSTPGRMKNSNKFLKKPIRWSNRWLSRKNMI